MNNKNFNSTRKSHKNSLGFTLIELMIVVAIIGLLAAIGFPAYNKYVERGKRAEGRAHLMDTAALLERYYSDNNKYATADNTFAPPGINTTSETGKYNVSITTSGTYQTYTLTATPTFTDADCGNLTLDQTGTKGVSGSTSVSDCWGR